jgi:hypothetical protein
MELSSEPIELGPEPVEHGFELFRKTPSLYETRLRARLRAIKTSLRGMPAMPCALFYGLRPSNKSIRYNPSMPAKPRARFSGNK